MTLTIICGRASITEPHW